MRKITIINEGWHFSKDKERTPDIEKWQRVTLPHSWNGEDGQDGGNDYHRGTCWYARRLSGALFQGREHYLEFDGVNSTASVYWNGEKLTRHEGGYATFRVKLDRIGEDNLLEVAVDNGANDHVYPQNADFTFYGGIYRDVKIISVEHAHFDLDYYGGPGIRVTPQVQGADALVTVQTWQNEGTVTFHVADQTQSVPSDGGCAVAQFRIPNVHLWNGRKDPYLYTAVAELSVDGGEADRISTRFGCRSFSIDPERGFLLNGEPYPLRGVSRHQDRPKIGNALLPEHHREDLKLILDMGANTVRLAHYQHSQYFYDLCDESGLVVWAEIPYITVHLPNGRQNTMDQMTELIVQNYNHPSIVVWGLSNEITGGCDPKDEDLLENHRLLNDLVHRLDPTRPSAMAVISMCPMDEPIVHISDVVSYNHYFGWYGGKVEQNGPWFDAFHQAYPQTPIGISEYGAEALNWHSSHPEQGDYTEEYQAYYHEEMIRTIAQRPYLWATHVWNMFDFAADARSEGGENGMNHKGLVTFDRSYRKDAYYAYQAWLSDKPMIHLCGKRYVNRAEDITPVTVYSNQPAVELYANGVLVERQEKGELPFFHFAVKLDGDVELEAKAGDCIDRSHIRKVAQFDESYRMKESGEIINWFEITAPTGYCCINDTVEQILRAPQGRELMKCLAEQYLGTDNDGRSRGAMGMKRSGAAMQMLMGFTVKRIISMAPMMGAPRLSKEEILGINTRINAIPKL